MGGEPVEETVFRKTITHFTLRPKIYTLNHILSLNVKVKIYTVFNNYLSFDVFSNGSTMQILKISITIKLASVYNFATKRCGNVFPDLTTFCYQVRFRLNYDFFYH